VKLNLVNLYQNSICYFQKQFKKPKPHPVDNRIDEEPASLFIVPTENESIEPKNEVAIIKPVPMPPPPPSMALFSGNVSMKQVSTVNYPKIFVPRRTYSAYVKGVRKRRTYFILQRKTPWIPC